MRRNIVFVYLILNIFVLLFSPVIKGKYYRSDWCFENNFFSITLLYSNSDREELILKFRLKENIEQYHFHYKLSQFSKDTPELLIMEQERYIPFKEINVKLNNERKEKTIMLKLAEDLKYKVGTYSLVLRPVGNPDLNPIIRLNLYHPRCAEIKIEKRDIHFNISSGTGIYGLDETINLKVNTNYSGWTLKVFSTPLFSKASTDDMGLKNNNIYISGERIFIACNGSQSVPISKEGIVIERDCKNMSELYLLELLIHSNSMDKAGEYSGGNIVFRLE